MSKHVIVIMIVVALGSYMLGRYGTPSEVVEVERVVEVEKVVERIVRDVVVVKEERPDGTVVTRTESKERIDKDSLVNRDQVTSKTVTSKPNWSIGVYGQLDALHTYTLVIDRRILGNLSVGVYGRTDPTLNGEFGVGLRLAF